MTETKLPVKNMTAPTEYLKDMEQTDPALIEKLFSYLDEINFGPFTNYEVSAALESRRPTPRDLAALLSLTAEKRLEDLAQKARRLTREHFGNSINLFTPLYIANYCENSCLYCGFNSKNNIKRARLNEEEIERELKTIAQTGLSEILILTGESQKNSDLDYIGRAAEIARKYFHLVGIEIYPLNSDDYAILQKKGVDYVTIFQETYDVKRYAALHPYGRKRVFSYRFNAQERALAGGLRGVGFGSLFGLSDFRIDALATGIHAYLIQRKYPHAEISFSCPRLRPIPGNTLPLAGRISQKNLLQIICAFRLFMPFAGITVSSRENIIFRNNIVDIAATRISAGVHINIGGHCGKIKGDEQFEINDNRSLAEIFSMLKERGLQPVLSDYLYV
ncbi:MAG: 2-iminoacetate synthase ThiH [Candidatus Adiutrix intracellularis]|jgi:2-iminoacetate synthase|nr:2-iminoacetate synthase ThiH [Candidatus Adiutrix intracellularis]